MFVSNLWKRVCFTLVVIFGLVSLGISSISAATFNTVPVNSGCSYPCSGYYTGHFDAKIEATNHSSAYWQTSQYRGTMTRDNQNGDQWGIMMLNVYSEGQQIYSVVPGKLYTSPYSQYWQRIYNTNLLRKGNNRIDFHFAYVLKFPSGKIAERWYPVRRASNIQ